MYYGLVVQKKIVGNNDDEDNDDVKVVDNNKGKVVETEEVQKEDININGGDVTNDFKFLKTLYG